MRMFPIPMDLTGEEKLIGGVLSLRQMVYLLGGGVCAVFFLVLLRVIHVLWALALPVAIIWLVLGIFLSFFSLDGMGADEYLYRWLAWRTRRRRYDWGDELSS
ncbi:PrgI family protein [Desulfotruncus alcoholivorax]|uniref:PrgI family protein n=1 Tax=Desulfotruncus alcoholivorax TaxID=265477 RepID=UPI000407DF81|nr:PrgI family protein [Desulfotruncus alcoholivorax]